MQRRVLITGASGYVAGWLISQLATFAEVELVLGSRSNQDTPLQHRHAHLDLGKPSTFSAALEGVDTVVHLAGLPQRDCIASPSEAARLNTLGTTELVHQADKQGVRRFILVSTIQVFGSPLPPVITSNTPIAPDNAYAKSYADLESELGFSSGVKIDVVRLANGFGFPVNKGSCWHLAVNDFCRQAVQMGEIRLTSSGLQQRNFVPIRSSVSFLAHVLMATASSSDEPRFWTFGSPQSQSVLAMAHTVASRASVILGHEVLVLARNDDRATAHAASILDLTPIAALRFSTETLDGAAHLHMIDETLHYCRTLFLT